MISFLKSANNKLKVEVKTLTKKSKEFESFKVQSKQLSEHVENGRKELDNKERELTAIREELQSRMGEWNSERNQMQVRRFLNLKQQF